MAGESSFDIVSQVDLQEVDNAINQVVKEMLQRYDFKGSKSAVTLDRTNRKIVVLADDAMKLRSIHEMLTTRLVKRGISPKALRYGTEEKALGGAIRQEVAIQQGISQEDAKEIVRLIKQTKLKVQPAIQGDQIRVSSKNKDDLQAVIQMLRNASLNIAMQFTNYRS